MSFFHKQTCALSATPAEKTLLTKTASFARSFAAWAAVVSGGALYAGPIAYAIGNNSEFGTLDLTTGAFTKISNTPPIIQYLASGANGNLLTMSFDGNLTSINPATGAVSVVGRTGFANCSGAVANLSNCQLSFGQAQGKYYTTDFNNNLYTLNPQTGQVTLVGKTGLPALPFQPGIPAADGSFGFYDENLFGAGGNLYVNFDTGHFQPPADANSNPVITETTPAALYEIDPATGVATKVGDTAFGQVTIGDINGSIYSFVGPDNSIRTLDVIDGATTIVGTSDQNVGLVSGVAAVPEPTPVALTCCGIGLIIFGVRKRILSPS